MMMRCADPSCGQVFSTLYQHQYWLCPKCGRPAVAAKKTVDEKRRKDDVEAANPEAPDVA